MKPLEKLTALLCEGSERVKEDIMELRFGCTVEKYGKLHRILSYTEKQELHNEYTGEIESIRENYDLLDINNKDIHCVGGHLKIGDYKIIGNNLHFHHLFMYCEENDLMFLIGLQKIDIWKAGQEEKGLLISYDITKPLYQQSDEVLEEIFNFLKG